MFSTKRLKKKSQSVDITAQGYPAPLVTGASQINKGPPPVAKTTTFELQGSNVANSQRHSLRGTELKRYHTHKLLPLDSQKKKIA